MKFCIKYLSSKFDQIRRKQRIWSHLLEKTLMEENVNILFLDFYLGGFSLKSNWGVVLS